MWTIKKKKCRIVKSNIAITADFNAHLMKVVPISLAIANGFSKDNTEPVFVLEIII